MTLRLRQPRALVARLGIACLVAMANCGAHAALAGARAPDFTLHSAAGPNLRLNEQRGQVVMLNFWATWCAPCRQEMPHLNKLYEKYHASGFTLLGINVDDDANNALGTTTKLGLQ